MSTIRTALARPTVLFALLTLYVVEASYWSSRPERHTPFGASLLCCLGQLGRGRYQPRMWNDPIVFDGERIIVVDAQTPEGERLGELWRSSEPQEAVVGVLRFFGWRTTQGLFGPVMASYHHRLRLEGDPILTDDQMASLRDQCARLARQRGYDKPGATAFSDLIAAGRPDATILSWPWLLHDAAMALVMIAGVWSMALVKPWRWLHPVGPSVRRTRTIAAGRCPACGYDISATPHQCPECGDVLDSREPGGGRQHDPPKSP